MASIGELPTHEIKPGSSSGIIIGDAVTDNNEAGPTTGMGTKNCVSNKIINEVCQSEQHQEEILKSTTARSSITYIHGDTCSFTSMNRMRPMLSGSTA